MVTQLVNAPQMPMFLYASFSSLLQDRQYLLTFKGAVYHDGIVLATPRRHLPALHNGHDVIILPLCSAMTRDCATGEEIPHTTLGPDAPDFAALCGNGSFPGDYDNLLTGSAFVAVLPGEGSHSYRLYEAMQVRCTPIGTIVHCLEVTMLLHLYLDVVRPVLSQ